MLPPEKGPENKVVRVIISVQHRRDMVPSARLGALISDLGDT